MSPNLEYMQETTVPPMEYFFSKDQMIDLTGRSC